jgi:small GTP-binding protein
MNFDDDYDMIFKIVLIGDTGVGKSNILSRYIKNEFNIDTKSTVGVEFGSKSLDLKGNRIKAQIWDTAGQERYKSITSSYYKGAKGAFIIFDLSRIETFASVDRWINELKSNTDDIYLIVIGNKSDLERDRKVTREDAEKKCEHYNVAYLETSALKGYNIEKAFNNMIEGNKSLYRNL